jgi:RND superfamily putative drug exporter
MSKFLYKIGQFSYRRPWVAIIAWLLLLAAVIVPVAVNGVSMSSNMSINGTKSQEVLDRLAHELPQVVGGQASIVFTAQDGQRLDDARQLAVVLDAVGAVYKVDHVVKPPAVQLSAEQIAALMAQARAQAASGDKARYGPLMVNGVPQQGALISSDGAVVMFSFQFDDQIAALPADTTAEVTKAATHFTGQAGVTVLPSDALKTQQIPLGLGELVGVVIAGIVLIVTLGSMLAGGLPLLTALVGVGVGVGGALAISASIAMTAATPMLGLMVGLAVGIDYALFIVNRQRRLILDEKLSAAEAAARATGTAGSAVFFAGLTVIVALGGLTTIAIDLLSTMALVAAATVALAVLVALTLIPALLGLVGERIVSRRARAAHAKRGPSKHGFATHWARFVTRYRWPAVLGVSALLLVAALPMASMAMGMPDGSTANLDSNARRSSDAIEKSFGPGFNGPLLVVAESTTAAALTDTQMAGITSDISGIHGVNLASVVGKNDAGTIAVITVIPTTGPGDAATTELVQTLRDSGLGAAVHNDVTFGVTGFTAINIDMADKLTSVFPLYMLIIVVLSLLILLLVFRSIVVPIKATVGFILSILATFGLTTLVFHDGWGKELLGFDTGGPLVPFIPIMVTGILYGLAMDYQVFLVSSMREAYVHGRNAEDAVIHGFGLSSRVVVAAAIIMVSVFSGFIFSDELMIKQMGFALAAGILIDAFLIRMTLVPAAMSIFGDKAWWLPRWLDKILPNLDIEGDALVRELNGKTAAESAELTRV